MNFSTTSFHLALAWPLEALKSQPNLDNVALLKYLGPEYFASAPAIAMFVLIAYLTWLSSTSAPVVQGPVAGYRSFLEPTFFLRFRFVFNAVNIMNDGYYKARIQRYLACRIRWCMLTVKKFLNTSYVVRRMDTDVTVLALKYLDELRKSGLDELNATHANIHVSSHDKSIVTSVDSVRRMC